MTYSLVCVFVCDVRPKHLLKIRQSLPQQLQPQHLLRKLLRSRRRRRRRLKSRILKMKTWALDCLTNAAGVLLCQVHVKNDYKLEAPMPSVCTIFFWHDSGQFLNKIICAKTVVNYYALTHNGRSIKCSLGTKCSSVSAE